MFGRAIEALQGRLRRVTSSGHYMSEVDGLRFVAVLPVVMFHLGSRCWRAFEALPGEPSDSDRALLAVNNYLWGAKTGVELFFVISGFIIAFPFVKAALGKGRPPALGSFYGRRLTRLEPPYILAVLGAFGFLLLRGASPSDPVDGGHTMLASVLASLVYLHGVLFQELPHVLPVGWSLEVEFEFYLLARLMFFLFFRVSQAWRGGVGLAVVVLSVLAINPLQSAIGDLIRFILPRYLHFFFAGVVLSDLFQRFPAAERRAWPDAVFVVGFLGAIASESVMTDYRAPTLPLLELARVACYASMFFGAFYGRWSPKVLGWGWLPTIGGMCYTIYLVHLPIQQVVAPAAIRWLQPSTFAGAWLVGAAASMPTVVVVCIVFFLLVEKPCMRRNWPQHLWRRLTGGNAQ